MAVLETAAHFMAHPQAGGTQFLPLIEPKPLRGSAAMPS